MMTSRKRYRISIVVRKDLESLKPHTGQIVEFKSIHYTVYTSSDKYVVLDAILEEKEQLNKASIGLESGTPITYKSSVPHKKDGVETYSEYSGRIHSTMQNEFNIYKMS